MEPTLLPCDPSLVFKYWSNKLLYSGEPYYCPPYLPTLYNVSQILLKEGEPKNIDFLLPEMTPSAAASLKHGGLVALLLFLDVLR